MARHLALIRDVQPTHLPFLPSFSHLLRSLDAVEEEANRIQLDKLSCDEENRTLRDQNFELQSRVRAAEEKTKKAQTEMMDKDKQLKIMTDQNRCVLCTVIL